MDSSLRYTWPEQMVVVLARDLRNEDRILVGGARHDIPFAAAMLAKYTHAPDMTLITTGQFVNPKLTALHFSGHTSVVYSTEADAIVDGYEVFELSESEGALSCFFYHGLQTDKFGNCNLHFIGDMKNPTVRGPGMVNVSMSVNTQRTYLFPIRHNKRTFVERVDFISAVGHIDGWDSRKKAGINTEGPRLCVSPLGVFDFHPESKMMRLKSVHQSSSVQEIVDNTGFELIMPEGEVPITPPPTDEEFHLLRTEIDPSGVLRGEAGRL